MATMKKSFTLFCDDDSASAELCLATLRAQLEEIDSEDKENLNPNSIALGATVGKAKQSNGKGGAMAIASRKVLRELQEMTAEEPDTEKPGSKVSLCVRVCVLCVCACVTCSVCVCALCVCV